MNRPWMPLFIADYRADTAHLGAAEHGAYLLLIMHYWITNGLPDDDRQLARIACMTNSEWKRTRPIVQAFFYDGWKHKRIDAEMQKTSEVSEAYATRARQAANKRWSKHSPSNASSMPEALHDGCLDMPISQPQRKKASVPKGTGANAPPGDQKTEFFRRGREVLGKDSGALLAKLLRSFGPEDDLRTIAKARARIEEASTKANPVEWLGRVMAPKPGEFKLMSGIEGVV